MTFRIIRFFPGPSFQTLLGLLAVVSIVSASAIAQEDPATSIQLEWQQLPDLPDPLGVAGPFVGVHNDALILAGGANFPQPVWENDKVWHDRIYVLTQSDEGYVWLDGGVLPARVAYGAAVSTPMGVVCMGGNDATQTFDESFLLRWNPKTQTVTREGLPRLPRPCAYGQAASIGNVIYLAGGQSDNDLTSAMTNLWALDLGQQAAEGFGWQELEAWPGQSRAFNLTVHQHNGYDDCLYVMSGRRQSGDETQFLTDVWEFNHRLESWRRRTDLPVCVMAGTGIGVGQSHILVLGGADGSLFFDADALRDEHPGFPKQAWAYHTITDRWTAAGATPANHVTTMPVRWNDRIVIASGEVRPRVRSAAVWSIRPLNRQRGFGVINYLVLFSYLLAMVAIGVYFASRNRNTDDYFRGGKHIPWWAAGCSIFATMLSSLTFTGIPSKAFAQDWVYAVGNMMIPVVAFVAVFLALPFYRRIDVTSAYEYLEKRFSREVRLFGSASFTLFHVFRMAVVMSLTGLALAVATPLTPAQSVLLMGALSILYCTMGGIEAVIWTDTIQTVVLLGGALLAIALLIAGTDGGLSGALQTAFEGGKLRVANFHGDATSAQLALWVVVLGAIGQNISSYTADQAVVQRYMTTPSEKLAARSIWTNAMLTLPATLLFFGMGTALFAFYRSHPEKLDPTITTDQIFPLFIANEMPVGLAGLIVAGVFSAAQSTVSTSMNSTATTLVTDFLRPLRACQTERGYLIAARILTFAMGVCGTLLGLIFVDPDIKSLFDAFIKVIGLFMGVLGGLFVLGVLTRRANAFGAMTGAILGAGVMYCLWRYTTINGYLYTVTGIASCFLSGYLASLLRGHQDRELSGLTIWDVPVEGVRRTIKRVTPHRPRRNHGKQRSIMQTNSRVLILAIISGIASLRAADKEPQTIDLNADVSRQIVVDREEGQYLGHPTTCLLEDGRTLLCVYPKGHGRGEIVYKRSRDGGLTWSDRLPTPASWATSKEVPTLHRVIDAAGQKRIIMWSGLYPARLAVTEDDGDTWSELEPVGDWGGIVVMGFVEALKTAPGHYLAMFHDDGRFFTKESQRTDTFKLYKTFSQDGGLTWSQPQVVFQSPDVHLCEPGCIRSPDGRRLAVLLRENSRRKNSHIIFSDDEGHSWTEPREVPLALTGDRHTGKYGADGRLFISYRCNSPAAKRSSRSFEGDWVGWVGTWEDLVQGNNGQYFLRLKDNTKGHDTAYPAVEVLPDGTFVTTTYGHWVQGKAPYLLSVRFTLSELDQRAAAAK